MIAAWRSASPVRAGARMLWRGTNLLEGCELIQFPRRSSEIRIRIYEESPHGEWLLVGEFKVAIADKEIFGLDRHTIADYRKNE